MEWNGNLILQDNTGKIIWKSNTANIGNPPYKLQLNNDGSISIIDSTRYMGSTIWNSATSNPVKKWAQWLVN